MNTWFHLAAILSGSTATIFYNGTVTGACAGMNVAAVVTVKRSNCYIDWYPDNADVMAYYDDAAIFSRALAQIEVAIVINSFFVVASATS